jgi:hypothetical protein
MGKSNKLEIALEGEVIDEVSLGIMYASLAITDDKKDTLKKVGRSNPWQVEVVSTITGSKEQAHKPLSDILNEDMNGMILDHVIDISGITNGGHFLDTQGYIAHNDDHVALAFRCTTSAFDWLTNFQTTSSAWELEEDLKQGFSGYCSGFAGMCCVKPENYKPRVHTGFYNNFLAALPVIKKYIDPFLLTYERPRKLFVVGHSLGAGIATLAASYFITEYNWKLLPQTLVVVTAGSPRACCESMKELVDCKRKVFGPKVRMYRVVKGKDVVVTVPPKIFGFRHLIDPIIITDSGKIVLRTKGGDLETDLFHLSKLREGEGFVENYDYSDLDDESNTKYDRMIARVPKALRDHMPDFYLKPMLRARGLRFGSTRPDLEAVISEDELPKTKTQKKLPKTTEDGEPEKREQKPSRTWVPKMFKQRRTVKVEPTYF